jgi:hypothetical protein
MARGANQKLKLLYLKQFFEEHTDEEHPATMQQILDYLKVNGVDAERKSIYTDLDALCDLGWMCARMNTAKATSGMTVILNWQK